MVINILWGLVQLIVIIILELISHMVLTYVVKKLPTHTTVREMTHVGFYSIGVVIIRIGSI